MLERHVYAAPTSVGVVGERLKFGTDTAMKGGVMVMQNRTHKMMRYGVMHHALGLNDNMLVFCGSWEVVSEWWLKTFGKLNKIIDHSNETTKRELAAMNKQQGKQQRKIDKLLAKVVKSPGDNATWGEYTEFSFVHMFLVNSGKYAMDSSGKGLRIEWTVHHGEDVVDKVTEMWDKKKLASIFYSKMTQPEPYRSIRASAPV